LPEYIKNKQTNKQTNKNRKTTEIIDRIVAHVHLFIIVLCSTCLVVLTTVRVGSLCTIGTSEETLLTASNNKSSSDEKLSEYIKNKQTNKQKQKYNRDH
jgi:hypothetical protein